MPPVPKPPPREPKRLRRPRSRNGPRSEAEFVRAFHSDERVRWVQSLASCYSGERPCVNAHSRTGGASRWADYQTIVPLTKKEHDALHQGRLVIPRATLDAWAERTEARWQS